ncbi:hypothetical protein EC973_001879 [Apophysomyces ossiformis]|uniref:Uncharacterized protein n=1 Tax=Apophysomyces ossiformis TaxID=679940 RepID=A0A8H7BHB9_9FUNG|nr:hypothetical protein EC973_001879 [Apophysomyces ossiformis]
MSQVFRSVGKELDEEKRHVVDDRLATNLAIWHCDTSTRRAMNKIAKNHEIPGFLPVVPSPTSTISQSSLYPPISPPKFK